MEESVRSTPSYVVRLARPDEAGQVCEVCTEGFTASSQGPGGLPHRAADAARAVELGVPVTEGNDLGLPFYLAKGFVMKDRVPFVSDDEGNVEAWSLRLVRAI